MEVYEGSHQISDILLHWTAKHVRLKNEFTEDEKYHYLMSWLNYGFLCITFLGPLHWSLKEPPHDKTNKMACAPSKDSDQPGHPTSLIRVFIVRMKKPWVLSYPLSTQRWLWSDWADVQADLSLHLAHMSCSWFCHAAAQIMCTFMLIF